MTIHAEWFGGPFDGNVYALPDGTVSVKVPIPVNLQNILEKVHPLDDAVAIRMTTCVLQRTPNGSYIMVWKEPHD